MTPSTFPPTGTPDSFLPITKKPLPIERSEQVTTAEHIVPPNIQREDGDWLDKDASR